MLKIFPVVLFCITPFAASAAIIADFQADTIGTEPDGWDNGNQWNVAADPTDASNHVLSTTNRRGNLISGTSNNATLGTADTGVLEFRVYFRSNTDGDISFGLTDVADLSTLSSSDADFLGPLIRLVDGGIQLYDGTGGGGGSFLSADQATSLNTWYTVSMTVDNADNSWAGTIVGGAFATPTSLTGSTGGVSEFGFRTDSAGSLLNLAIRANNNNGSSYGAFLDDISLTTIPEPQTYALLVLLGVTTLLIRRRR